MPDYKIRLSDNQVEMISLIVDAGKVPGLIRALEAGAQIIICDSGNPAKERQLYTYLKDIGANVINGQKSFIVSFDSPRLGRGGERPPRAARSVRSDSL